jgi:hypothetical protein
MATVDVLMVVDVEGALSSQNLTNNIYLVDTNKYIGSGNEGQAELQTKLSAGDIVQWSVAPVQPDGQVTIASFSGGAVQQNIIKPQPDPTTGAFSSKFNTSAASGTSFQYTSTLQFESQQLTFDPFLIVK